MTKIKVQYTVITGKDGNLDLGENFVKLQTFRPNVGDHVRLHMEEGVRVCLVTECVIMESNPQVVDILVYCKKV